MSNGLKSGVAAKKYLIVPHHGDDDLHKAAMEVGGCGFLLKDRLADLESLIQAGDGEHHEQNP